MRFFLLRQDEGFADMPRLINWFPRIDVRAIDRERYHKIAGRTALPIAPNASVIFTDALTNPIFLVSKVLRDVIEMYDKGIPFRQAILLDDKNDLMGQYYLPILEKVACLSAASETNLDASVIRRAVLRRAAIGGRAIAQIGEVGARHILARLDLVESALRRGARGFTLQPTFFEGEAADTF
jgi:hypothetical protein